MAEVLHAMGIAGAILLPVVLLILIVSITAVKRGEASMGHGAAHHEAAAAAAPVSRVSLNSYPGSAKLENMSTQPGLTCNP